MNKNSYLIKDNSSKLPERHRTGLGYYTIGLEAEVYRTNGFHNSRSIGIAMGYVSNRGILDPSSVDPATGEWIIVEHQIIQRISQEFRSYDHLVIKPHNQKNVLIVAPQTLERELLIV